MRDRRLVHDAVVVAAQPVGEEARHLAEVVDARAGHADVRAGRAATGRSAASSGSAGAAKVRRLQLV